MLNEAKQHFFKKLIEDTIGYYRIYDFVKTKFKETLNPAITFSSAEEFWKSIHQGKFAYQIDDLPSLKNNQLIKLKDFVLTEWTPKLPGRVWTKDGSKNLFQGLQDIIGEVNISDKIYKVLGPLGKEKVITGGFGTVRVKPRSNKDYCMLLNAVSRDNWKCDYGIPIVVSKSVYDKFIEYSHNEGAPEIEELRGTLILNKSFDGLEIIEPAIGANIGNEIKDLLSDFPDLQKCFVYVSSPLDIKLRYNKSHPDAIAWTMFKTNKEEEPLRLTYAQFNPIDDESSRHAVEFINQYVLNFDGIEIMTDFDGQKRRLISKVNLADTKNFNLQFRRTLGTIENWIKREQKKLSL